MKRIVVAVDGSEGANRAAKFAANLARDARAALTLVHVYDAPTAALLGLEAQSTDEVERTKNVVAKGSFEAARQAIGDSSVPISTHVSIGHPAHEIVTFAETSQADLLVMGSRGLSSIRGLLLGSVSEYVVRHAGCPVTIVR